MPGGRARRRRRRHHGSDARHRSEEEHPGGQRRGGRRLHAARAEEGTFFVDVMASPGAGKTTLLLALIRELRARGVEALGVIEADLSPTWTRRRSRRPASPPWS
ncbi:MAG: hypothetical protein ACLSDQ_03740 [Adlercreutzia equolifaciens]